MSLDYKKAPEYPYPHALDECYDVYRAILQTRGACVGLNGDALPRIVVSGDSAGGNLATSMVLKVLASVDNPPAPDGLVLAYPCLNMKVEAWMTPEQVSLVGNQHMTTSGLSDQAHSQDSSTPTNNTPEQTQNHRLLLINRPHNTATYTKLVP
ncbi:hormone-sensitive lipase [Aspergillus sp. HF37]|nr:hormone-sensitive lipase [Aspergillus sp. HF37]